MPGRSTIHQVARELGVSASTVSRAFNNPNKLLPSTVARVKEKSEEMGYVPNRHAQALSTGRTGIISLVVPDITNPFFPPMIRAAQRTAESAGLNVMVVETNSDPDRERSHIASLLPHCEGILIASPRLSAAELQGIAQLTPLVLLNNDTEGVARVLLSTRKALCNALHHFSQMGARRVCYIGGPARSWSESERRSTIEGQACALGLTLEVRRVESGTYAQARHIVAEDPPRADLVIGFDDIVACATLDGLADAGVDVPGQTSLLGCDDALPVRTKPRISTITVPTAVATHQAVKMIMGSSTNKLPEQRLLFHGELRIRET
ncbi:MULTISPECIES: LacI family DNA-binding transcriptional regulator [unclassified Luteococcus]|uniref:LacI family DNA-binding transcriptional regulator n=1 Tax=unclassified Luteococcus TaxID=2639923 RepID=UPI00313C0995